MFLKTLTCWPLIFYEIHVPPTSQLPGFSFYVLRSPHPLGDHAWLLNRLRGDGSSLRCVGFAWPSSETRSGGIPSACRLWGLPGQCGGEGCMHMWESLAWRCTVCNGFKPKYEDQELTPCLKALSTHCSAQRLQQQAPCQTALWFIPCSQQCWNMVQGWVPTAACSVWPLFSSPHQFTAVAHVPEKLPGLRGLMPKPVADGRAVSTVYALNLAILHILTCIFLWHWYCSWQGLCSPHIMPNCHETTPSLFLPWLHLFFIHLLEPRPRASANLLKWIDW